MKTVIFTLLLCASLDGQITQVPSSSGGGGSGSVTSVDLVGTSGQLTVTGTTPITSSGSWTISIPNPFVLPGLATIAASTTGGAGLRLTSGVAPTAPTSGDFWNLSGVLQYYDGAATKTLVTKDSAGDVAATSFTSTATGTTELTFTEGSTPASLPASGKQKMFVTTGHAPTLLDSAGDTVAFLMDSGTLAAARMPAFTGDVSTAAGAVATTLATVSTTYGTCGDATHVCAVTTNAKGLVTAQSAVAITASGGDVLTPVSQGYDDMCGGVTTPGVGRLNWGGANGVAGTAGTLGMAYETGWACGLTVTSAATSSTSYFIGIARQAYTPGLMLYTRTSGWDTTFLVKTGSSVSSIKAYVGTAGSVESNPYTLLTGSNSLAAVGAAAGMLIDTSQTSTWRVQSCGYPGGVITCNSVDTGVSIAANTVYRLRLRSTTSGTLLGSVNGGTEYSITIVSPAQGATAEVPVGLGVEISTLEDVAKSLTLYYVGWKLTGQGFTIP